MVEVLSLAGLKEGIEVRFFVQKNAAIMQNMIFDSVFEVDSVLEKNKSDF